MPNSSEAFQKSIEAESPKITPPVAIVAPQRTVVSVRTDKSQPRMQKVHMSSKHFDWAEYCYFQSTIITTWSDGVEVRKSLGEQKEFVRKISPKTFSMGLHGEGPTYNW